MAFFKLQGATELNAQSVTESYLKFIKKKEICLKHKAIFQ